MQIILLVTKLYDDVRTSCFGEIHLVPLPCVNNICLLPLYL